MKIIATISLLIIFACPQIILAESHHTFKSPWKLAPGVTLPKIIKSNSPAKISGSNSISWPDGRSVIVVHVSAGKNIYRCVDYYDSDFQATGHACYILKTL